MRFYTKYPVKYEKTKVVSMEPQEYKYCKKPPCLSEIQTTTIKPKNKLTRTDSMAFTKARENLLSDYNIQGPLKLDTISTAEKQKFIELDRILK